MGSLLSDKELVLMDAQLNRVIKTHTSMLPRVPASKHISSHLLVHPRQSDARRRSRPPRRFDPSAQSSSATTKLTKRIATWHGASAPQGRPGVSRRRHDRAA